MIKCNLAIFLGAGFSKEADLPIMSEFGKYSTNQLQSLKSKHGPNSNSPRNAASLLISKGELFENFRKYFKDHMPFELKSFSADDMEDLFTMAEMMDNCGRGFVEIGGQKEKMRDVLFAIKLWLWQIFHRIPIHNPSHYKINIKPYEEFINTLQEYGLHQVSIITTNYDMILEYLFHQKGIQVCYPISEDQFEFNDLCAPGVHIASGLSKRSKNSPILCKLHGSINFFVGEKLSNKKLQIVADTAKGLIGKSKIKRNTPSIMALDAIHELAIKKNLIPAIIPPTYAKLEDHRWLNEIWRIAVDSLIVASKWLFVGYRFPSSDGFMKSLINLSLISRKHAPEIVVVNRDKSGNTKTNYDNIFGEKNFHFEKKKFSEFINSGLLKKLIDYPK